jgi:uncharacterized protein (PEP-CTERM system associated)
MSPNKGFARAASLAFAACTALWAASVQAQDEGAAPAGNAQPARAASLSSPIVPSLSVQETVTSNRDLSATDPQTEAITQVSPGIRLSHRSGRVQGSLAYTLNALMYARARAKNTLQNALDASVTAEAVPNLAYLDARASISQVTVSAFGTQSQGTGLVNANSTEVATASVSPSLRSSLGGFADASARLNWTTTHSASTATGDASSHGAELALAKRYGVIGWGLNASRQVNGFKGGQDTTQDAAGATLSLFPFSQFQMSLRAGWQANDVMTGGRQTGSTTGWGINWRPTDRTDVGLQGDRTYYGHSHGVTLRHRMARSVWSYSDAQGVTGGPGSQQTLQPLTLYDLLTSICLRQGGDPAACDQAVRVELARQGLNPNVVVGGFLGSALALQRSQNLAVALSGLRTTLSLSGFRTVTSRLGQTSISSGDLSQVSSVRQLGLSLGVSHALTPGTSLALTASKLRTLDAGPQPGSGQRLVSLALLGSLGPRTSGSVSLRRTLFESATSPYNESAVVGSLSLRF